MVLDHRLAAGDAPVLCQSSEWLYTDHGGMLEVLPGLAERVRKGDIIARITSVYTKPGSTLKNRIPASGWPSPNASQACSTESARSEPPNAPPRPSGPWQAAQ